MKMTNKQKEIVNQAIERYKGFGWDSEIVYATHAWIRHQVRKQCAAYNLHEITRYADEQIARRAA